MQLPTPVEFDKIEARYENGLLRLVLPRSERHQARRISLQSGSGQPQLASKN